MIKQETHGPLVALFPPNIRPKVLVLLSFSILSTGRCLEAMVNTICGGGNSNYSFFTEIFLKPWSNILIT